MDLDYDSLFVLSAVLRTGSFDGAAKQLNVTQSAVSQRIKQLEERVGALLVVRGRPCVATEDGLLLCEHVEQVMLLQHELMRRMGEDADDQALTAATIRIGVNNDSLATWFPAVVKRAADEINLRLEVISDDQDFTEERLKSGDALAVVTTSDKPVPGCQHIALGKMDYLAVATPGFAKRHFSETPTFEEVSTAPSVAFDRKDTLPEQWLVEAFGETVELSAHHIPSYEGHIACCLKDVGWVMMPEATVGPMISEGKLMEIVPGKRVSMPLFWQARSQSSAILRRLSQIVAEEAEAGI